MKERQPFTSHVSPEFLLLGLLSIAPSHGYDLHRQIERDLRFVWRLSLSQVYNVLARLEKQGMIEGEILEQQERPDRKRFRVTAQGEYHLQNWFDTPVGASVRAVRIAFLSKLYLAQRIPGVDFPTLFKDQRAAILKGLSRIENSYSGLDPSQRILRQSLRLRIMQLRSLLTWLTECQDANIFE